MKRIFIALFLAAATAAFAQDKKAEPEYNSVREFRNKVFEVHHRDAREIAQSVKLLGSGFKGADLSVNEELKTITVRDFPENIAAIDEAIKRLDHAAPAAPDIEFKISVLIASRSPLKETASIPDELEPVVKQLQSTLRYSHYGLMTASVQRTKAGLMLRGSGVAEPTLLGMTPNQERPVFYDYSMTHITTTDSGVDIERFSFSMRVPIAVKTGEIQYQNVGFETPVSLRDKEKVVIGTTTMGDKALIVVVTATK